MPSYLPVQADGFPWLRMGVGHRETRSYLSPAPYKWKTTSPNIDRLYCGGVPTWDPTPLNKKVHRKEGIYKLLYSIYILGPQDPGVIAGWAGGRALGTCTPTSTLT